MCLKIRFLVIGIWSQKKSIFKKMLFTNIFLSQYFFIFARGKEVIFQQLCVSWTTFRRKMSSALGQARSSWLSKVSS